MLVRCLSRKNVFFCDVFNAFEQMHFYPQWPRFTPLPTSAAGRVTGANLTQVAKASLEEHGSLLAKEPQNPLDLWRMGVVRYDWSLLSVAHLLANSFSRIFGICQQLMSTCGGKLLSCGVHTQRCGQVLVSQRTVDLGSKCVQIFHDPPTNKSIHYSIPIVGWPTSLFNACS